MLLLNINISTQTILNLEKLRSHAGSIACVISQFWSEAQKVTDSRKSISSMQIFKKKQSLGVLCENLAEFQISVRFNLVQATGNLKAGLPLVLSGVFRHARPNYF